MGASGAIWGVIKKTGDGWAIRNKNANLGEFEGTGNEEVTGEKGKVFTEMTSAEIVEK